MTARGEHGSEKDAALPDLDRGALVMADLAWIETEGSASDRTKAAVEAYLWAVRVADETGFYPSLNDWRTRVTPPGATS